MPSLSFSAFTLQRAELKTNPDICQRFVNIHIVFVQVREDPRASAPPEIISAELHKGLHYMLIKGVIPANQDLSDALVGMVHYAHLRIPWIGG